MSAFNPIPTRRDFDFARRTGPIALNRRAYWGHTLTGVVMWRLLVAWNLGLILKPVISLLSSWVWHLWRPVSGQVYGWIEVIAQAPFLFLMLAHQSLLPLWAIRRLHDLGKPAWWAAPLWLSLAVNIALGIGSLQAGFPAWAYDTLPLLWLAIFLLPLPQMLWLANAPSNPDVNRYGLPPSGDGAAGTDADPGLAARQ
jgi:uncharacterized membrane protein YhaH (DUF805 family)